MADIRRALRGVAQDLWHVPQQATEKAAQETGAAPAFEEIWKAVDEGVDWTEMLALPAVRPALACLAADVLAGDIQAYRAALEQLAPLDDLGAYCMECAVDVIDADTLSVAYKAAFAADDPRRAAGVALRAARDLLAALPVATVHVRAVHADGVVLEAAFSRDALRHIRVNVVDPEEIAAQCGTWL